jgi:hypothetical protein
MSLFKKVMIIALATMALGSAAMGDDPKPTGVACPAISQTQMQQSKPLVQDAVNTPPVIVPDKATNANGSSG